MSENYMLDPTVRQYYDQWMESPTYFSFQDGEQHFYKFVKACIDWSEKNGLKNQLDIDFFKDVLIDEVKPRYQAGNEEDGWEDIKDDILFRFKTLLDFEAIPLPE